MLNFLCWKILLRPRCVDEFEQETDPRFLRRGRRSQRGCQPIMEPIFPENCMKMNKIGPREASKICLCRSATWSKEGNTTVKQKISSNAIKAFLHRSFCTNAKQMHKLILFPSRPCVTQQGSATGLTRKKENNHVWFETKTMNKLKHELSALCIWSGWWVEWCVVWCKWWCRTVL